jgi:hypothetical protein
MHLGKQPQRLCTFQPANQAPPCFCVKLQEKKGSGGGAQLMQRMADEAGVSLGPIGLTIGGETAEDGHSSGENEGGAGPSSIATLSTTEWRARYEQGGVVDLWVREEFNSGSRLVVS